MDSKKQMTDTSTPTRACTRAAAHSVRFREVDNKSTCNEQTEKGGMDSDHDRSRIGQKRECRRVKTNRRPTPYEEKDMLVWPSGESLKSANGVTAKQEASNRRRQSLRPLYQRQLGKTGDQD